MTVSIATGAPVEQSPGGSHTEQVADGPHGEQIPGDAHVEHGR
jgi:hypothetical protein